MRIEIPVAGVELQGITDQNVIYTKQLPVWPTRPMMIKIYPDKVSGVGQDITVAVNRRSTAAQIFELPYEDVIDFDVSFVCPMITRADRQKSTEIFAASSLAFYGRTSGGLHLIELGVFHCDLTYGHTIQGDQASLPEPPKIKMPGQGVDIYYPFATASGVTFPVEAEPTDDADPTAAIMPTVYELGKTLDTRYIKKLTIKGVWGMGLDHVIEYENRNWDRANEDDALLCALRVRWNMQNGEWFWDAFKNFFWSNNFKYIRGLGGATEQADVTVNMEYGPDKYAVYQQLMISSQILMDLNIPGINQHQYKVFRAEVVSDSGARWSGSTRTYRQQVRFRTMELQDNYISPVLPDSPAPIPVQFRAYRNPWSIAPEYSEGLLNNVTCNSAWEVQSTPDWLFVGEMVTLTAADFEQGGLTGTAGTDYGAMKTDSVNHVRSKNVIQTDGKPLLIRAFVPGYSVAVFRYDADSKSLGAAVITAGADATLKVNAAGDVAFIAIRLNRTSLTTITPTDATAAQIGVIKSKLTGKIGTTHIPATVLANTGAQRTANLVLKSLAGGATYTIPVTQAAIQDPPVQPEPPEVTPGEMVTLTAADFERGWLSGSKGTSYEDMKAAANNYVRVKNPIPVYGKPLLIRAFVPGFAITVLAFDADMKFMSVNSLTSGEGKNSVQNVSGAAYYAFMVRKNPSTAIAPTDAAAAQIGVAVTQAGTN